MVCNGTPVCMPLVKCHALYRSLTLLTRAINVLHLATGGCVNGEAYVRTGPGWVGGLCDDAHDAYLEAIKWKWSIP